MVRGTLGDERQVDFDGLYADAKQTVSNTANRLRTTTQRFREAYSARYEAWQRLRDQAAGATAAGQLSDDRPRTTAITPATAPSKGADLTAATAPTGAAAASATAARTVASPNVDPANAGADRTAAQQEADRLADGLARARSSLARLELATEDLERSWLFLERGRAGSDLDEAGHPESDPVGPGSLRMHILEAQESERSRLAEDLHDGPAQALANALFQIEIIHRSAKLDPASTDAEVRSLQTLLERELDAVRDYISQLRPALLQNGDLVAALRDSVSQLEAAGIIVETDLAAPDDALDGPRRTVALRVAQEAMRNARKHSGATHVWLKTRFSDAEHPAWILEVRDDGSGFDPEEIRGRGSRRHFGLRFMRERADLIGARLDIEPEPSSGTLVRLTVEDTERSQ